MAVAAPQPTTAANTPASTGMLGAARGWLQSTASQVWAPRLLGHVLIVGAWQYASGRLVPAFTLPSPVRILAEAGQIIATGVFWTHFGATVRTIAIGSALAFVMGLGVGIAMARPWIDALARDWVVGVMNTPGLVFVLIATMIFGFHPLGPITAIVLTSFPFVTINVAEGVRAIPKGLLDIGTVFGVGQARSVRHVVIPFLAPYTFAGLRYGFSMAWKITTLAELFGASRGIGFMIRREFELFSMAGMLAWIGLFCTFTLVLEALLQRGMRRHFRWRPAATI